jgi:hypothetical protein
MAITLGFGLIWAIAVAESFFKTLKVELTHHVYSVV